MAQALRLRRWGWFCILCRGTKLTLLRLCVCLNYNDCGQHNGYYVVLNNKNRQYTFIKCSLATKNRYNELDLLKIITKRSYFSRPKSVNFM